MHIIICQRRKTDKLRSLAASAGFGATDTTFVLDPDEFCATFSDRKLAPDLVVVEASLSWRGNSLQSFYGLDVAQALRRDHLLKCPIVFLSILRKTYFENNESARNKYGLLKAKGSGFLALPCSVFELKKQLKETKPLTDAELNEVIVKYCGVREAWRLIAHQLGGLLSNYHKHHDEIKRIAEGWSASVHRFAPDQKEQVEELQRILNLPTDTIEPAGLRRAVENLDARLQGGLTTSGKIPSPESFNKLPKHPPQGFSRVLIADDEPQPFLISSLTYQFGYHVFEQAYNLSQAINYLDKYKPDVVLADYYFKKSLRETEIPDKDVGDRFINHILKHASHAGTAAQKPIILVTSKAMLRSETDIRAGAINCSGAYRATDPSYIHSVIWAEARKMGAIPCYEGAERHWPAEYSYLHRLEQYQKDLPRMIRQWEAFEETVRDTLRLCRLLSKSRENDDLTVVRRAVTTLEAYESVKDFSLAAALELFAEVDGIHLAARTNPHSWAKKTLRNILHGKIEQFSQVTSAARFLIATLTEVAETAVALEQYEHLGRRLVTDLNKYAENEPLLPLLTALNLAVQEALSELPAATSSAVVPNSGLKISGDNSAHIIVVEDNNFWQDVVASAIEEARSRLGARFTITYECFDNAADALARIPSNDKSYAIAGGAGDVTKTVLIVDICLPENSGHSARIRAAINGELDELETPGSEHGLDLVRSLSGYGDAVPIIIFSTIDSIDDRRAVGDWGVADEDFLVKGVDDAEAIVRALIRKIEKKSKYVIEKTGDDGGVNQFRINGIPIRLGKELERTFSAVYTLCQRTGSKEFTVADVIGARGDSHSDMPKKFVQEHIYRIRNSIHKTLMNNRVYVDVHDLIRTVKPKDGEDYFYQLNAEVMSLNDEPGYEADLDNYTSETCRVLIADIDQQTTWPVAELLEGLGYQVERADNVEGAVRVAREYLPHIVSIDLRLPHERGANISRNAPEGDFGGLEAWDQIRMSLNNRTLGVIVPTAFTEKSDLVAKAAHMGIPLRNFISKREVKWLNHYLTKVASERRRVFLGEIPDAKLDFYEPIVKILEGSDFAAGVLKLTIDERPIRAKVSRKAQVIGLLLQRPKTLLSFEFIKQRITRSTPVTENDAKNWPKRIKDIIEQKWLTDFPPESRRQLADDILESSSRGMLLNAHVIDLRT